MRAVLGIVLVGLTLGACARLSEPAALPLLPVQQNLFFATTVDGKPSRRPYYLSLPRPDLQPTDRRRYPLLVFLHGIVEGGEDHQRLFIEAIPLYLRDNPDFPRAYPFIFLCPQAPYLRHWEDPEMVRFVIDLIEQIKKDYPVDPDRVYLTGLSNGGTGTWQIALTRPDLFAAIAPVSGRAVNPAEAGRILKNVPAWIIVGGHDGDFVQAARTMKASYEKNGGNVRYHVVPNFGHVIWDQAYLDPALYTWLLEQARPGAPSLAKGLNIAKTSDPAQAERQLAQADALRDRGDEIGAYRAYRILAMQIPNTPVGRQAKERMAACEKQPGFAQRYKKVCDEEAAGAMLNIAQNYQRQRQNDLARQTYQTVAQTWPLTDAARKAQTLLPTLP